MSSIKIQDLVEKTDALSDEDLMIIEDSEDTKKITLLRLKSAFSMDSILTSIKDMLVEKIDTFIKSHETKYSDLEHRNKQLESRCHNLENDHIHDADRIFELENRLILETSNVEYLETENNRLLKLVANLQNQKDILAEEIVSLKTKISDNENLVLSLTSEIEALNSNINNLKITNESLQSTVKELEKVSNDNIDNTFLEVNSKLESSIMDLISYIRYYHPDVDDVFGLGE